MSIISKRSGTEPGTASLDEKDGSLNIYCKGCTQFPDPSAARCISCICEAIGACGTSEVIRLTGTREMELSGDAAEIFCDLARLCRPMAGITKRKCAGCPRSPEQIYDSVWSEFPDLSFAKACSRLYSDSGDGPECAGCLQRTYLTLTNCDAELKKIEDRIASVAGRKI